MGGLSTVVTPPSIVDILADGWPLLLHPSAGGG
jgi:hypothetical protein